MKMSPRKIAFLIGFSVAAACEPVLEGPAPSLANPTPGALPVEPPILCQEQHPDEGTAVVVHGAGFAPIAFDVPNDPKAALPALTLIGAHDLLGAEKVIGDVVYGGQRGEANADLLSWQSQEQMTFIVNDALLVPSALFDVQVANPNGASATSSLALAVAPRPHVATLDPPLVCVEQGARSVVVNGSDALRIGDDLPLVTVGDVELAPTLSDCAAIAHPGIDAETCATLTVEVPQGALAEGAHRVVVENPAPAQCSSSADVVDLVVVPPPTLVSAEPTGVCALEGGVVDLAITGTGFLQIDGAPFSVTVAGSDVTPTAISGCTPVTVAGLQVESCTSFVVSVDTGALPVGGVEISVTNPDPAGCSTASADLFAIVPTPTIDAVAPPSVCSVGAGVLDVTVSGAGFLRADGTDFSVTVNGASVTPSSITGCAALALPGVTTLESCDTFVISVDASALPLGDSDIVVTNPEVRDCTGAATSVFSVLGPPAVSAVIPNEICSDRQSSFDIVGTNFGAGTSVTIDGRAPDTQTLSGDGTTISVTYDDGFVAGVYDVVVSNGDGCESTFTSGLTVNPTPLVFFVDPPVLFNGITTEATIFVSGIDETAASVDLIDAGGAVTNIPTFDSPDRPSRILATVDAGLVAAGDYQVRVTSADGCDSSLNGRVSVTDELTLTLDDVDPSFVSPTIPTAVTVIASGVALTNLPRVYLSPSSGAGSAIALRAVDFKSATQLAAVVTGAAPDTYDLIVVNPTGEVGLLPQAITVTQGEPPIVTSVAPASLNKGQASDVVVNGQFFDSSSVTLECVDFIGGASVTPATATVNATTANSLDVTIDASTLGGAAPVCVVVVTNADGSSFRFSAISFKEPAQNLNAFQVGEPMIEARRAHALAAGRPTETSRFLYAIGGDDGTAANTKTSVEAVPIDPFGAMGAWAPQRNSLANAFDGAQTSSLPRAFAGVARVGRFVYLVGGDDGTDAQSTLLRAQILDPLAGPEIVDLDAALGDGVVGMPEGLWLYRVSALFPTTDASNPGGESLAGDLFNVDVPAVDDLLQITLIWNAVPGASAYRVYRAPGPNGTADQLELLAEVTTTSFLDDNTLITDPAVTPMPAGSLGVWHAPAGTALSIPRAAPGVVAVPAPTPGQFFLYAVGGRTTGGTVVDSGEYTTITIAADGSQTVDPWTPLTASLTPARSNVVGLSMTSADTPVAAGNTFVFFACGRLGNGNLENNVDGAAIEADGDILAFDATISAPNPARVGAAGLGANGFLFLFGGANGAASNNDVSTSLLDASPTLDNWNALGDGTLLTPRVFHAAAQESAFFFVGGGVGSGGAVLTTVEQTIQ